MAEEKDENEYRRNGQPKRPCALAYHHPDGEPPERQSDAEFIVHDADEKDVIVKQRKDDQGRQRPRAEQGSVERESAGGDQHECRDDEQFAGEVDVHHLGEDRHRQIHHQIRDELPIDFVEAGEVDVLGDAGDHMHPGEMIDVILERRQRVRDDRNRRDQHEESEDDDDLRQREVGGSPAPIKRPEGEETVCPGRRAAVSFGVRFERQRTISLDQGRAEGRTVATRRARNGRARSPSNLPALPRPRRDRLWTMRDRTFFRLVSCFSFVCCRDRVSSMNGS